jgi:hypothetical protein
LLPCFLPSPPPPLSFPLFHITSRVILAGVLSRLRPFDPPRFPYSSSSLSFPLISAPSDPSLCFLPTVERFRRSRMDRSDADDGDSAARGEGVEQRNRKDELSSIDDDEEGRGTRRLRSRFVLSWTCSSCAALRRRSSTTLRWSNTSLFTGPRTRHFRPHIERGRFPCSPFPPSCMLSRSLFLNTRHLQHSLRTMATLARINVGSTSLLKDGEMVRLSSLPIREFEQADPLCERAERDPLPQQGLGVEGPAFQGAFPSFFPFFRPEGGESRFRGWRNARDGLC